jgi:hypothetical protein
MGMKTIDDRVVFSNICLGAGFFEGVMNITLGVALFTPEPQVDENGKPAGYKVDGADVAINNRLRLDMPTARALYEALGDRLRYIDSRSEVGAGPIVTNGAAAGAKPN